MNRKILDLLTTSPDSQLCASLLIEAKELSSQDYDRDKTLVFFKKIFDASPFQRSAFIRELINPIYTKNYD